MPTNLGSNRGSTPGTEQLTQAGGNKITEYIGIAAEDKKINSRELKIFIKDLLPFYQGKLTEKKAEYQVDGGNYKGTIKVSNVITATWFSNDTNRRYPPDVKKGEQVKVQIYSDQDQYHWTSLGRDDDKRRTERISIGAANTPNDPTPVNMENSYGMNIDTQDGKTLTLHTSKSAGEKNKYMLQFSGDGRTARLSDDNNNEIIIESEIPRVYMRNNDGGLLELSKKNITIIAPEDFLLKVGRQAIFDIPALSFVNTTGGGATVWDVKDIAINAKTYVVNSPVVGLKGAVEIDNLVSGPVHAVSYSTIAGGSSRQMMNPSASARAGGYASYVPATINKAIGSVTNSTSSPNMDGGGGANRHCTAWEDIHQAIQLICADLEKIDAVLGYGNNVSGILAAAASAIMKKNTGE